MRKVIGIGETVFDIIFKDNQPIRATPGGSTFNSIISIGRAGIPAEFISETGEDRVGRRIMDFLEENGVSARSIFVHKGQKSALSLAFLNENNDAEYAFYKDHANDRLDFVYPEVNPEDIVIFGSFYAINPVVRQQVRDFLQYASSHGAILYYDVNFRASHKADVEIVLPNIYENLALADIVRGSHEDFQILLGLSDVDEIYRSLISRYVHTFIYTCGAEPAILRFGSTICKQYPVSPVRTVSTIGAGDSFNAGIACGLILNDITRSQLHNGLAENQWDELFVLAQAFSGNVCQSFENYISLEFAKEMAARICQGK